MVIKRIKSVLERLFGTTAQSAQRFETSANFDRENVRPFLERLNSSLALNLDVAKLSELVAKTAIEQEQSQSIVARFRGEDVQVVFRVFMDDVDSPGIYFISESKPLADAIDTQIREFTEELGI